MIYQHLTIDEKQNNKKVDIMKLSFCKKYKIRLPNNIPLSSIVKNDAHFGENKVIEQKDSQLEPPEQKWLVNSKAKCYLLYLKYVGIGSAYEINISFRTRRRLITLMDNYQLWMANDSVNTMTLFVIYNQCCKEMFALIQGSFSRFKSSSYFKKFQHLAEYHD